jgi:hypothetical protein
LTSSKADNSSYKLQNTESCLVKIDEYEYKKYPLQFDPIVMGTNLGWRKIKSVLNKPITSKLTGESWELSTVEGDVSVIANGQLKGTLTEVINGSKGNIRNRSL